MDKKIIELTDLELAQATNQVYQEVMKVNNLLTEINNEINKRNEEKNKKEANPTATSGEKA